MKIPRSALPFAVLTLTALSLSCDSNRESVSGLDGLSPTFRVDCTERPDHPQCPDGGGSGGSSGPDSDLTLAGGYVAATASADIETDNKKFLKLTSEGLTGSTGLTVEIDFDDTDIYTCTGDLSLFPALDDPTPRAADFGMQVMKASVDAAGVRDPANWIRLRRSEDDIAEPFVVLNFSTGTDHPDALVTMDSGDINDASQPRVLRFSEGAVRVTQRIDQNTSTTMICDQADGDDVVVTIEPSSP